jgi:(p)ppGpp synthase/HD superfamily hydrolase
MEEKQINSFLNTALSNELVLKAKDYAIKVHQATNHKYDCQPYETHLQIVFDYACKYAHLLANQESVIVALAASWTHDTIEDCRQTYSNVNEAVGSEVADVTYALTNEKGKTRKERGNEKYYNEIKNTPIATFVKICDRLANTKYSKQTGNKMIEVYKNEQSFFRQKLWDESVNVMFEELEMLLM